MSKACSVCGVEGLCVCVSKACRVCVGVKGL